MDYKNKIAVVKYSYWSSILSCINRIPKHVKNMRTLLKESYSIKNVNSAISWNGKWVKSNNNNNNNNNKKTYNLVQG